MTDKLLSSWRLLPIRLVWSLTPCHSPPFLSFPAVLARDGHKVILEKIEDWNVVELMVNEEVVFHCNIKDLEFGKPFSDISSQNFASSEESLNFQLKWSVCHAWIQIGFLSEAETSTESPVLSVAHTGEHPKPHSKVCDALSLPKHWKQQRKENEVKPWTSRDVMELRDNSFFLYFNNIHSIIICFWSCFCFTCLFYPDLLR